MRPVIIVNFKTYTQGTGKNAVKLAKICEEAGKQYGADIRIAVQVTDINAVASAVSIPVYAQHVDPVAEGKHTGWISAAAIKAAGASGTLLNHSEHWLTTPNVVEIFAYLKREHLDAIICAESVARLRELDAHVKPVLFAIEPPELIGGDVSISVARPDIVGNAVHATSVPLLLGAGVKDHNDLAIALQAGAHGVLLSSHIVLAKDPRRALRKLLSRRAA